MPGAHTHDFITLVTAAGADMAYFEWTPHPNTTLAVLFTASYVFAGYACAGDLDLNSTEYRRWGPLRVLWWPYRQLVPHRSWISHGLIMGGVIRALYLACIVTLLFWGGLWVYGRFGPHVDASALTRAEWSGIFGFAHTHPQWTLALLSGFVLAGSVHSIADAVSTGFKRRF
jgi:uncharacterized metal-binding protein